MAVTKNKLRAGSNEIVNDFLEQIINSSGGFKVWEDRECVMFPKGREIGIAEFVLRCLANPECKGSQEILEAIEAERNRKKN